MTVWRGSYNKYDYSKGEKTDTVTTYACCPQAFYILLEDNNQLRALVKHEIIFHEQLRMSWYDENEGKKAKNDRKDFNK